MLGESALKKYLIGTGGWAYFRVPGLNSLTAYSRTFNFVEVNSTFYQIPPLRQVEKWRMLVPPDFHFSVRAHRSITHRHKLGSAAETFETLEKMRQICAVLKTDLLHFQIPSSIKPDGVLADNLRNIVASANMRELRLALELRGEHPSKLPAQLLGTMQDHNMIHCVDLSKGEKPAYDSDIMYTRLFGRGNHNIFQPTDEELVELDEKASNSKSERIVMSFHFVRMYTDAARLKIYRQSGKFPKVTKSTGFTSLEEIISQDARFPATRSELMSSQGWKLFDMTENRRIRAGELLEELPDRTYGSVSEIIDSLRPMMRVEP